MVQSCCKFVFILVCVVLICARTVRSMMAQKLLLTVYYESYCPDSKTFVLEQLQPAVQMLQQYLKVRLIPFGKSQSLDYGFEGFDCQHGQLECFGNMLQDCALDIMRERPSVERVAYVACEAQTEAGSRGGLECVEKAGLAAELVSRCVELGRGTVLQMDSEYYTSLVAPQFIPTVTVGGIFNQQIQDMAQVDLVGTLCSLLKETPPCAQYYNNIALEYILSNLTNYTFSPEYFR